MKKRGIERVSKKIQSVRRWLTRGAIKREPELTYAILPADNAPRDAIKRKPKLKWWLVYGPPRAGTSYMLQLIKLRSTLYVSDWGLGLILDAVPGWIEDSSDPVFDYIRFDRHRFFKDVSDNILDNAYVGGGGQLDLVYKQATLRPPEYQTMVKMWGPPERAICCIREPVGYIASAVKKFINDTVEGLQQVYVNSLNSYEEIKGDVFDYTPELTASDYVSFLKPLNLEGKELEPFQYQGEQDRENTTEEMWSAYHKLKELVTS